MKCAYCAAEIEYMDEVYWDGSDNFMCADEENPHYPARCNCPCHEHGIVCIAECGCGNETKFKGVSENETLWLMVVDPFSRLHEIRSRDGKLEIWVDNLSIIPPDQDVMAELFKGE